MEKELFKTALCFILCTLAINSLKAQNEFITTWEITASDKSITIPTTKQWGNYDYNYTVDWGDGNISTEQTANATHNYATAGTYTVKIEGDCPRLYFSSENRIKSIEQWGNIQWASMSRAFEWCSNLTCHATDAPDLSNVTDMSWMFSGANSFNADVSSWDVSNVTDMNAMFSEASSFDGKGISSWNVSNVTDMDAMFYLASRFNADVSSWDVSNVTDMGSMFEGVFHFNGEGLSSWDVSNVTDMGFMFSGANSFNADVSSWDVSSVIKMNNMFEGASSFNGDLSSWDVSNVTDMSHMFFQASFFSGIGIFSWNVSNVTDMSYMFSNATSFYPLGISSWDVSNVTDMSYMFSSAGIFWGGSFIGDVSSWNVSNVTDMSDMFSGVTLSTENYNKLLKSWSEQSVQSNVEFDGGGSKYCAWLQPKKDILIGKGWSITDGGFDEVDNCSFTWNGGSTSKNPNEAINWQEGIAPGASDVVTLSSIDDVVWNTDFSVGTINIDQGGSLRSTGTIEGIINYKSNLDAIDWYMISAPVSEQSVDAFVANSNLVSGQGNDKGLAIYDNNQTSPWRYYQDGSTGNGNLVSGKGRAIKLVSKESVVFSGSFNNQDITIPLIKGTVSGFNLLGNPYTSYLFTKNLLNDVNVAALSESTIWMKEEKQWKAYNKLKTRFVSPTQGFFVEVSEAGDFVFTEEMQYGRLVAGFSKKENSITPEISLKLSDGAREKDTDIFYAEGTSRGFDDGYDSSVFKGEDNNFVIYTRLVSGDSDKRLAVQSLPKENYEEMLISIGVKAVSGSTLTFSATTKNLPVGYELYLEDKLTNTLTEITSNTYQVTLSEDINEAGRFYLQMRAKETLGAENTLLNTVNMYVLDKQTLQIEGVYDKEVTLHMYNTLGEQVVNNAFSGTGNDTVTLPKLPMGVYMVALESIQGITHKKIFLD